MLYDDDKAREQAADFKQRLEEARQFAANEAQKLAADMRLMMAEVEAIRQKPQKTFEDFEMLAELQLDLKTHLQRMMEAKAIIGESLTGQSTAYYNHIKKLAAEGNEEAQKILADLQPAYQAMLQESMNNNLQ
jgi:uncharacterized lipoprotein YehR (DUF1307 family)